MAELLLLILVAGTVALVVAWPLLDDGAAAEPAPDPEREALTVRHRLALEALRDIEADHRAGSLDDAGHAAQRAEADAHAARTLTALDAAAPSRPAAASRAGRRLPILLGGALAGVLLLGFALPAPFGTAERTETNQSLADAIAREEARRQQIADLLVRLEADPRDAAVLSGLADAYLAGGGAEDRRRGAAALLALLALEPENESAYRRLITAYVNAGAWTDARAATEAYAHVTDAGEPDVPFFRGLIALRGSGDASEAIRQFDRFLELAPDDPRAAMIRSLRAEAAGEDG